MNNRILVLGSGPGGLAAALQLLRHGFPVTIFEKQEQFGGLQQSVKYKGHCLDFGYKQMYPRITEVVKYWTQLLDKDLLHVNHRIGVLYKGHLLEKSPKFRGPLRGIPLKLIPECALSLLIGRGRGLFSSAANLEDWSYHRRGKQLTRMFSQNFSERMTGRFWVNHAIPVKNSPDHFVWPISFHPTFGSGQITEKTIQQIIKLGGELCSNSEVLRIRHLDGKKLTVTIKQNNIIQTISTRYVISALPIETTSRLANIPIRPLANEPSFSRSVIIVYLFLSKPSKFPHHVVQVSSPDSIMGRITNYSAYPGKMVKQGKGCIGVEIFLRNDDPIHNESDRSITTRVLNDCHTEGIINRIDCEDSLIIRLKNADPAVGWEDYREQGTRMRLFKKINQFPGLYNVSRAGIDKSTHAGLLAAKAIREQDSTAFHVLTQPHLKKPWLQPV